MKAVLGPIIFAVAGVCSAADPYTTMVSMRGGRIADIERIKKF